MVSVELEKNGVIEPDRFQVIVKVIWQFRGLPRVGFIFIVIDIQLVKPVMTDTLFLKADKILADAGILGCKLVKGCVKIFDNAVDQPEVGSWLLAIVPFDINRVDQFVQCCFDPGIVSVYKPTLTSAELVCASWTDI